MKLALIAVGVAIGATHRVKDCLAHLRATWQGNVVSPQGFFLLVLDARGTLQLIRFPNLYFGTVGEPDYIAMYCTCGVSTGEHTGFCVVTSPTDSAALHHHADRHHHHHNYAECMECNMNYEAAPS